MKQQEINLLLLILVSFSCVSGLKHPPWSKDKKFPDNFLFGASSSAYQIEGAWDEDGRGLSLWDVFLSIPGKVADNTTAHVACDSYHKYNEDIAIMKELGLNIFRLSIAWPRIFPNGTPSYFNQAGIDHYINVLKALREAGIEPLVVLHHWDLPQYLEDLGGWLNPKVADYFADYARVCFKYLGPYVKYWVTFNEPSVTCQYGYELGILAPGKTLPGDAIYQCAYVYLLAHAKAYHIYDKEFRRKQKGKVAFNVLSNWYYANSSSHEDLEAQQRAFDFGIGFMIDPIYKGNWPKSMIERIGNRSRLEGYSVSRLPELTLEERRFIKGTSDFFTLNMYNSFYASYIPDYPIGSPSYAADMSVTAVANTSWPQGPSLLYSHPPGIRHILNYIQKTYNPSEIIIAENGWANLGGLDDEDRITYLQGYMSNILDAIIEDGVKVIGYTPWALLDSFEWVSGYIVKFGLVHVDFNDPNRTRTLKRSATWYQEVIETKRIVEVY